MISFTFKVPPYFAEDWRVRVRSRKDAADAFGVWLVEQVAQRLAYDRAVEAYWEVIRNGRIDPRDDLERDELEKSRTKH